MKRLRASVRGAKILLFDIETAPNLAYVWGKYEQDVISFKEHWYMITFAYKWLGETHTHVWALPDFRAYKKNKIDDKELCHKLWELINEADIVIGHNCNAFDVRKSQARFVQHGFPPPAPFRTIDTRQVARKYFKFDSNKLDDLGDYLKIGRKKQTGGFSLWLGCIAGKRSSWKKMSAYNKQDVKLLEKIYFVLRPWIQGHPNLALMMGKKRACPNCGSSRIQKRGFKYTLTQKYQSWYCWACKSRPQSPLKENSQVR